MKKNYLLTLLGVLCIIISNAQISEGGLPLSFESHVVANPDIFRQDYQIHTLLSPDMEVVYAEDAVANEKGKPYRVGVNIPVSYNMLNSGTWLELPNGDKIWRLGIEIPDAQALSLYFSERVMIPADGKLHAYNEKHSQYVGAYTSATPSFFAMEMIQGDLITLEYYMPAGSLELPIIEISEIAYYYRGVEAGIALYRDGDVISEDRAHGSCQVDAMCEEADDWFDERRATVRYTFVAGGTFLCTGTVINNTAEDCTPYILSANHCGEPNATSDFNNHVWYFNYQRPTCTPGNTGSYSGAKTQTMSGGIFRASSTMGTHPAGSASEVDGCDFVLAELETPIPTFYHAYYAGWNRNLTPAPKSGVCFHHPAGDEKKISTYNTTITNSTYNGGWSGAHWSVKWVATTNGHGVTEGGSSGSALLDSSGNIVGHLSGGSSFCTTPTANDLYGKFQRAWDQDGTTANAQLKSWLDPGNTNVMTLAGTYGNCALVSTPVYEKELTIAAYPNPTYGLLSIDLRGVETEIESIELWDATGRLISVLTSFESTVTFDLTDFPAGVYFIQVHTPDVTLSNRVVKL